MKGKQLFLLLFLAAIAIALWYFPGAHSRIAWSQSAGGGGKVLDFPINEVAHLRIRDVDGELNLVKKGDVWVVRERADYPASFEVVSGFLRKLWELKVGQEVRVGPSQMSRLELVEPGKGKNAGTVVEVRNAAGQTLGALLVGKKYGSKGGNAEFDGTMDLPKGRYIKPLDGPRVLLVPDPLDDARPKPELWLSKNFFNVTAAKSIALNGPAEAQSWTLTRQHPDANWKLAGAKAGEQLDDNKTYRLRNVLATPTFFDVLAPGANPAEMGLDQPMMAKIDTFDGFHYELGIGRFNGETYPTRITVAADLPKERAHGPEEAPEVSAKLDRQFQGQRKALQEKLEREQKFAGWTYLVPKVNLEVLLKDRSEILSVKPAESASSTPAPPAPSSGAPPVAAPAPASSPAEDESSPTTAP